VRHVGIWGHHTKASLPFSLYETTHPEYLRLGFTTAVPSFLRCPSYASTKDSIIAPSSSLFPRPSFSLFSPSPNRCYFFFYSSRSHCAGTPVTRETGGNGSDGLFQWIPTALVSVTGCGRWHPRRAPLVVAVDPALHQHWGGHIGGCAPPTSGLKRGSARGQSSWRFWLLARAHLGMGFGVCQV